ncbi:MAG: STAS domain-containing protein [Actinomycetes bacterium]
MTQTPAVEWSRLGPTARVALSGEFDISMCPALRAAFRDALLTGPADLVVEICALTFVDSTAVSVLVAAQRRATASGVTWRMHGANRDVRRVLSVMRLESVLLTEPSATRSA